MTIPIPTSWSSYLTTLTVSSIGGGIMGGLKGGALGLCSSLVDEYLMEKGGFQKHYLSTAAFWTHTFSKPVAAALSSVFPNQALGLQALSYLVGSVALPYLSSDFLNFNQLVGAPSDSFITINNFFDPDEVLSIKEGKKICSTFRNSYSEGLELIKQDAYKLYQNEFFCSFMKQNLLSCAKISLDMLFLNYLSEYEAGTQVVTLLKNHLLKQSSFKGSINELKKFPPEFTYILQASFKITLAYLTKEIAQFWITAKEQTNATSLFNLLCRKCSQILVQDGNGVKILGHNRGSEILQKFEGDIYRLQYGGISVLTNLFQKTIQTFYGLHFLETSNAPILPVYSLSLFPSQWVVKKISTKMTEIWKELNSIYVKIWESKADVIQNLEQINLRDGSAFIHHQNETLQKKCNSLKTETDVLSEFKNGLNRFVSRLNRFVEVAYFSVAFLTQTVKLDEIFKLQKSVQNIIDFLGIQLNYVIVSSDLIQAKERLDTLMEIIKTPSTSTVRRTYNSQNKIIIDDYVLKLEGKTLLEINHLELEMNKRYALTGKSGCGKTSFVTDLKKGLFGSLSSSGEISLGLQNGKEPKMMFIDQNLYLPKSATLLESIYFPNILELLDSEKKKDLEHKILKLFEFLEIDPLQDSSNESVLSTKLDSTQFKLSGGQKKKIGIIQAILNQPEILIMDETFAGLDKSSLIKSQQALRDFLPQTMMISIDHHAHDHNQNQFYDSEIHFEEQKATEVDL